MLSTASGALGVTRDLTRKTVSNRHSVGTTDVTPQWRLDLAVSLCVGSGGANGFSTGAVFALVYTFVWVHFTAIIIARLAVTLLLSLMMMS